MGTLPATGSAAGATGESLLDGNKNFIFIGRSIANNFTFILVAPSKPAQCVQELPPPDMRWHKPRDVFLSSEPWALKKCSHDGLHKLCPFPGRCLRRRAKD